jgi:hypothetical protein
MNKGGNEMAEEARIIEQEESESDEFGFDEETVTMETVIEEPVDEQTVETEPEAEPEIDQVAEPDVEQEAEVQQVEEPVNEQPDVDDVAGIGVVDDELVDNDLAQLREQNAALLERIESLSGQVIGGVQAPAIEQPTQQAAPPQQPAQPQTVAQTMNYLENTSIDDLLENPEKFNAVLNQVSQQSQAAASQQAVQQVLRSVPELVMGYITRHSAMNRMVDDFYKENVDLADVKQTVAAVANDVHSKNPGLGVEDVFKQSAEQTRKLLGLKKQAITAVKRKPSKPAFAKAGGARKAAPKVSVLQTELNDLLKDDF